ncbi:MAG TPA: type IV secretory system conjugative DNA transfer family protein [Thermoanaerobaculia bacterium]|jgi:type IV secretion system protein VirD4|nr:type IV secretory system conjugative DNA transfer family protein [Thermoanaerobaculia bacterium]
MDLDIYQLPGPLAAARTRRTLLGMAGLGSVAVSASAIASSFLSRAWGAPEGFSRPLVVMRSFPHWLLFALVASLVVLLLGYAGSRRGRTWLLFGLPPLLALGVAAFMPLVRPVYPMPYFRWRHVASLRPSLDAARNAFLLAAVAGSPALLPLLLLAPLARRADTHGSARFSRGEAGAVETLPVRPATAAAVVILAGDPRGRERFLVAGRDSHVLVLGPSGCGKTSGIFVPTLHRYPGPAIVFDLKNELYRLTAGARQAFGPVYRWDPSTRGTHRYNPVLAIPQGDGDVEAAQAVADLLVNPDADNRPRSFWEASAHSLETALLLHARYSRRPTLASCLDLFTAANVEARFRELQTAAHDPAGLYGWRTPEDRPTSTHPVVAAQAGKFIGLESKVRDSILATAASHLEVLHDPLLAEAMSSLDFSGDALRERGTLYLSVRPTDVLRLRSILRIVIVQLVLRLTQLPASTHPVLLVLDELPALGPLAFLQTAIAYLRGYGIRLLIAAQSHGQLVQAYGRDESITANCGVLVAFPPGDLASAEHLSRLLGSLTVHQRKRSRSSGRSRSTSTSEAENARPLLSPDEVRRLPADRALVFVRGHHPILAQRRPYFDIGEHMRLAGLAAPGIGKTAKEPVGPQVVVSGGNQDLGDLLG